MNTYLQLGDTVDPDTRAYADEQQFFEFQRLEAERRLAQTVAERAAEDEQNLAFKRYVSGLNVHTLQWNLTNPATLPLSAYQEQARQASLRGDFAALNKLMPFSIHRWNSATPLGKFRFKIIGGRKVYVPFSDQDLQNFLNEPWIGSLIEPGASCDLEVKLQAYIAAQKTNAQQFPSSDWRHVYPIYPGRYICQVYKPSTWVRWRGVVVTAVGIVAAIYLGPVIYEKIGGALQTAAGEGAQGSTLFQKVKAGVEVYNKASTANAIIHGELPPPPIGISGSNFTEWAMNIAKKELINAAKDQAMQLGVQYIQRKLTEKEEAKLRAEIEAMQAELAKLIPAQTIAVPDPDLQPEVRDKISEIQDIERKEANNTLALLALAIPATLLLTG